MIHCFSGLKKPHHAFVVGSHLLGIVRVEHTPRFILFFTGMTEATAKAWITGAASQRGPVSLCHTQAHDKFTYANHWFSEACIKSPVITFGINMGYLRKQKVDKVAYMWGALCIIIALRRGGSSVIWLSARHASDSAFLKTPPSPAPRWRWIRVIGWNFLFIWNKSKSLINAIVHKQVSVKH